MHVCTGGGGNLYYGIHVSLGQTKCVALDLRVVSLSRGLAGGFLARRVRGFVVSSLF